MLTWNYSDSIVIWNLFLVTAIFSVYFWFFIRSDAAKMSSQKLIRVICIRAMAFRWTRRVIFISFVASVLVWLSCCKLDFYEHGHLSAVISIDGSVKSILCTVTVFYV